MADETGDNGIKQQQQQEVDDEKPTVRIEPPKKAVSPAKVEPSKEFMERLKEKAKPAQPPAEPKAPVASVSEPIMAGPVQQPVSKVFLALLVISIIIWGVTVAAGALSILNEPSPDYISTLLVPAKKLLLK